MRKHRRSKKRTENNIKLLAGGSLVALLYLFYKFNKDKKITQEQFANIHGVSIKNVNIIGDGSCMFRAISHQITNDQNRYKEYRIRGVEYIRNNILTNDRLRENFAITIEAEYRGLDYETYLIEMETSNRWGDSIMLQALANTLNRSIIVINFENYSPIQIFRPGFWNSEELGSPFRMRRRPIAIGYVNRNHYLCLQPL